MKTLKNLLLVDAVVQSLMVGGLLFCLLSFPLFQNGELLIYAVLALIPFGAWQVLSAVVIGLGFNETHRKQYLLGVTAYFLLLGISVAIFRGLNEPLQNLLLPLQALPPLGFGIWYFGRTIKDFGRVNNRARSFWDLT